MAKGLREFGSPFPPLLEAGPQQPLEADFDFSKVIVEKAACVNKAGMRHQLAQPDGGHPRCSEQLRRRGDNARRFVKLPAPLSYAQSSSPWLRAENCLTQCSNEHQ